jgi:menaquinone-dependent protoporphyrinogen IX oxidase
VVVGGPKIVGWHRAALGFLKKNREAFQRIPLAVFVMAMSLTKTGETSVGEVPVHVDEKLPTAPEEEGRLTLRERYARLAKYVQPILMATRPVKPVNIGIFGGRLEYGRLKWWAVLFVMLIIQAPAGDRRNWTAIRSWADWFGGLTITLQDNGDTLLTGPVIDQAALQGLLKKVRDLGMPLVSVGPIDPGQADTSDVKP